MIQTEATLTIDRNPSTIPVDTAMQDAREATRAAREKLEQVQAAPPIKQTPAEQPPHEPIEDVESVEVQLPNGMVVEFGPPRDISLTMRVIKLLGDDAGSMQGMIYQLLLSIRSINGTPVPPITNTIEGEKLANKIGDAGIDILLGVKNEYWKPIRVSQLPILKKNLRK